MPGPDEMKPSTAGVKLTYDDFLLFPDDGQRHELIDGEHHVTPSPNTRHQDVLLRLTLSVGGWLETHPIGRIFFAPYDVVLSRFDVVEPDLLYLSHQRAAQMLTPQHAVGAPELVSKSPRRVHGNAMARTIRQAFELSREVGDVLTTTTLPGLELPLSRVLRD
jgi:hypothetical protein